MDWNRIEGDWKRLKGNAKEQWGRLTDDDLAAINGRREQLEGKLQERYGYARDRIKREIDNWASEVRTAARKVDADLSNEVGAIKDDVQKLAATIGDVAKRQAGRAQDNAVDAMHTAENYVRQNPLLAVAIAAGLGFLYGVFTRR